MSRRRCCCCKHRRTIKWCWLLLGAVLLISLLLALFVALSYISTHNRLREIEQRIESVERETWLLRERIIRLEERQNQDHEPPERCWCPPVPPCRPVPGKG